MPRDTFQLKSVAFKGAGALAGKMKWSVKFKDYPLLGRVLVYVYKGARARAKNHSTHTYQRPRLGGLYERPCLFF